MPMPIRTYPTDEQIIAGLKEKGSLSQFARDNDIPPRSLIDHVNRNAELKEKVQAVREGMEQEAAEKREQASEKLASIREGEVQDDEVLREQVRELTRHAKQTRKHDVMEERIFRRMQGAIPTIEPKYEAPVIEENEEFDEHEFLLNLSDLHAGEVVDSESVLGMNEYNWEVMLERLAKVQKSVISYQRNRPYPIKRLVIAELGDMLSGDIHDELRVTNEQTAPEAVVQLAYDLAEFIAGFEPYFPEIHVAGVPGNHPRGTAKPEYKLKQNNGDWLLYNFQKALLREHEQITWRTNEEGLFPRSGYSDVLMGDRWRVLLMHGDGIRSTMPGVPWGGVARRITTLQQQFSKAKQPIDYVCMGHFHTANAIEGVGIKTFVNGSIKGVDEYGLNSFGHGSDPSQMLLTFHPQNGITDVSYIDLIQKSPAAEPALQEIVRR